MPGAFAAGWEGKGGAVGDGGWGDVGAGWWAFLPRHWLHYSHFHPPPQTPLSACNSFNSLMISSDGIRAERSRLFFSLFLLFPKLTWTWSRGASEIRKAGAVVIMRHQLVSLNFHTSHTHRHVVKERTVVHFLQTPDSSPTLGFDEIEVAMPWLSVADAQTRVPPQGAAI